MVRARGGDSHFCSPVPVGSQAASRLIAGLSGLGAAAAVAVFAYGMPVGALAGAITYGAAFGLFPICWIVFWAIVLYRITVDTGNFEILKDSIGGLTEDRRLQALLTAFRLRRIH